MADKIDKLQEEKENLEQELIEQKFKGVKGQLMALGDTLHARMDVVEQKNEIQFKHLKDSLEKIERTTTESLKQAKQTNGRVTEIEIHQALHDKDSEIVKDKVEDLEKNTKVVRFMHKYPTITVLSLLSAYLMSIYEIRELIKFGMLDIIKFFGKIF